MQIFPLPYDRSAGTNFIGLGQHEAMPPVEELAAFARANNAAMTVGSTEFFLVHFYGEGEIFKFTRTQYQKYVMVETSRR